MAVALNGAVALAFELGLVGVACALWLALLGWLVSGVAFAHIQENRPI